MRDQSILERLHILILQKISQGKTVYLVSKKSSKLTEVFSHLKKTELSDLILNPNISYRKEMLRILQEDAAFEDYTIVEKYVFYYKKLNNLVNLCSRSVFGDLHWQDVVERAVMAQFKYSKEFLTSQLRLQNFDFDRKEYWRIRGRVESFSKIFSTNYIIIESINLFHDSVYRFPTYKEASKSISKELNSFTSRVYDLMNQYIDYFGKLRNDYQLDFHKSIGFLNNELRYFCFKLEKQSNKFSQNTPNRIFSFSRKKINVNFDNLLDQWNSLQLKLIEFDIHLNNPSPNNIEGLIELVEQSLEKLSHVYIKEEVFFNDYLKQLNVKGQVNGRLAALEEKLDQLIKELNDSSIFTENIENYSISSLKKFELLKELQAKLFMGQEQLTRFEGYYQWKSSLILLDSRIRDILAELVYVKPENWVHAFDAWYLSKVAELTMPRDFPSWKNIFSEWEALQTQLNFDSNQALVASKIVDRVNLLNQHKRTNSNLYKSLLNDLELMDFSEDFIEFVHSFFPVQFVSEHVHYSGAYNIDLDKPIHNKDQFSNRDTSLMSNATSFYENLNNKLQRAESLACLFLANNSNIVLYVSKEAKYILQLSEWKLNYFISFLKSNSLKRIHIADFPKERLTEFFLIHEIPTFFVYEDFTSGAISFDSMINQKVLTNICSTANIEMISIDSYRLLFGEKTIQSQLELLHGDK